MQSLPPPAFPSGGGGPLDMACLSPGCLGFISLGCIAVGAADAPRRRGPACAGGLSALGLSFISADLRVEGTCRAARQLWDLGFSLPSLPVRGGASGLRLAFKTESVKWEGEP